MIEHHPGDELLLAYGAGASDEAISLLVATHLALCPRCRAVVRDAEAAGGASLENLAPDRISEAALARAMARLDNVPAEAQAPPGPAAGNSPLAPEPLRSYLGGDLSGVKWKRIAGGISYFPLLNGGVRARLIRSAPGAGVGQHTHGGEEFTLCLTGGYSDATGHYERGDVQTAAPGLHHKPVADAATGCITLAVTDAPLKFRSATVGLIARLFGF